MNKSLRISGIDCIGAVQWGAHFCQFYKAKEEFIEILVPYFEAGLENNEFCLCVTADPLNAEEAKETLKKIFPTLIFTWKMARSKLFPVLIGT